MKTVEKTEISKAMQLNSGSNREAVALYLAARAGKPLKIATVAQGVFDNSAATSEALGIVRYLQCKIEVLKLGKKYQLTSEVNAGGVRFVTFTIVG